MTRVLIRNASEDTVESFRRTAQLKGISLEQELRDRLEKNTPPTPSTPEERVAVSRAMRARRSVMSPSLTPDEIREGLDWATKGRSWEIY